MIVKLNRDFNPSEMTFLVNETHVDSSVYGIFKSRKKPGHQLCKVEISLPLKDLFSFPIHNSLKAAIPNGKGSLKRYPIMFSAFATTYHALNTALYHDKTNGIVAFLRQTARMGTRLTIRHENITDSRKSKVKLTLSWFASKFAFWIKPVLLFEKNGRHCEESARAVFEKLIDEGYSNAYFILSDDVLKQNDLDSKYRSHVISQHSLKHYLYFFRCQSFLGTEAMAHALELRCQNYLVQKKIKDEGYTYVFLQHGVMYMVSLDSPQRSSFRRSAMHGRVFIVASSELEADHFIQLAGFKKDDIIVCGLPKFDRSYLNDGADKILIMPTWRVWEFNEMRHNPENTNYVRMTKRIVESVPENLREKIVVARHPLFNESTFQANCSQGNMSYDELLRDVSLLITDYSSISYDSFYRGSNVIFYWEELEECMKHYGGNSHLMLTEDTAFGPVCDNSAELQKAISDLYGKPQAEHHIDNYRKIVQFHDGKNTSRLIEALRTRDVL